MNNIEIEAYLSLKHAYMVAPNLLSLYSFNTRKNIHVLGSITDREPEYLEMRRTYAQ